MQDNTPKVSDEFIDNVNKIVGIMADHVDENGSLPTSLAIDVVFLFNNIPLNERELAYATIEAELHALDVPYDPNYSPEKQ